MKRFCFLLLLSSMAWAQGSFVPPQQALKIVNGITSPVPNATVTVCAANAAGLPCAPALVGVVFKDIALSQPLPNPFTSDANGNYQFAIAAGTYTVTVTAAGFAGYSYQISPGVGGGPATPGGSNTQVQFNNSGVLGGLGNVTAGSALVSQGVAATPAFQVKPIVDVRDSASSFDCSGTIAMDTGMQSISSTAHVMIPTGCIVRLTSAHSYPQTFEFTQGGMLKPDTGVLITMTGPIIAGSYQIFSNALATQGGISFQGNNNTFDALPEWWGASTTASAATNTTAIQAAIYGAFGCNTSPTTSCRTNGSGLNQYNKPLYFGGLYTISGELHWYHVINFIVKGSGRLSSGIVQSAANSRIFDGQSDAYGVFRDVSFSTTAAQDLAHPLFDIDFSGAQGADIKPQFIDFFNVTFNGAQLAKTGVRIAQSGGGAQGSNINFFNNLAESFTEAAYMVGAGSGCVPTQLATNAIQIAWYGGDMQANHAYGIEDFGGAGAKWDGGTAENGGNVNLGNVQQTGADFCSNNIPNAGGAFTIKHLRSESTTVLAPNGGAGTSGPWNLIDVVSLDDISGHGAGGGTTLGDLYEGETSCGHGLWWKVTTAGTLGGLASRGSPLTATGGSATTIVDSVGGFTVNAWVGFYVCTVSASNTPPEYCVITSNTANTFTCSAGFVSDFPAVGTANPVNGTLYDIQPAWTGTTVTSGTTTLTRDDTAYSGINLIIDAFFPGKRVFPSIGSYVDGLQVTRFDWATTTNFVDAPLESNELGVLAGSPATTAGGIGSISLNPYYIRTWVNSRNTSVEVPFTVRRDLGTRVLHWFSGISQGGQSVADDYIGTDTATLTAGQGDFFILNNSSNIQKKWTFNFDGSLTVPTTGGTAATAGTGFFSNASNNLSFAVASGTPLQLSTNDVAISQRNLNFTAGVGQHINTQAANNDIAGVLTCATSTATKTFSTSFGSTPVILVSDETTSGGVKVSTKSASAFTITCTGATDVVDYIVIGNPN